MKKLLPIVLSSLLFVSYAKSNDLNNNPIVESLLAACKQYNIAFVEFCCTDFLGNTKSVIRPIEYLEYDLNYGIYLDGSSIPGCTDITQSDILLKPAFDAIPYKLTWYDENHSTIRITCNIYLDEHTPYSSDPRYILKKAVEKAHSMGYRCLIGPELECYIFEKTDNNHDFIPIDNKKYADSADHVVLAQALANTLKMLNVMNLKIAKSHHEVGPGQFEFPLEHDDALIIADRINTTKLALKVCANAYNTKISFMPKPLAGKAGNGMHLNISLFDQVNNRNAFYDYENNCMTAVAQSFIAGILKHIRECTLLLNPSINSYKRLVKGHEAPVYVCCGKKNRSALIRLPSLCTSQPQTFRMELRSPDALCNPYLAFAVLLQAGLKGIEEHYLLPPLMEENLYTIDETMRSAYNLETLPQSLEEAINLCEQSSFVQEILGKHLFDTYLASKRKELAEFCHAITDWEIERYQ